MRAISNGIKHAARVLWRSNVYTLQNIGDRSLLYGNAKTGTSLDLPRDSCRPDYKYSHRSQVKFRVRSYPLTILSPQFPTVLSYRYSRHGLAEMGHPALQSLYQIESRQLCDYGILLSPSKEDSCDPVLESPLIRYIPQFVPRALCEKRLMRSCEVQLRFKVVLTI